MVEEEMRALTLKEILIQLNISDDVSGKLSEDLLNRKFVDMYDDYLIKDNLLTLYGIKDNKLEINLKDSTLTNFLVLGDVVTVIEYNEDGIESSLLRQI